MCDVSFKFDDNSSIVLLLENVANKNSICLTTTFAILDAQVAVIITSIVIRSPISNRGTTEIRLGW